MDSKLFKSNMPECDLSRYFTQTQLDEMSVLEKMIKFNKMKNYFACRSLNLECELPDFIRRPHLKDEGMKQDEPTKLSEEVKRLLLCTEIPLSYYKSTEQDKKANPVGGKDELDLPLCKNDEQIRHIWENFKSIAPKAIKEMEAELKIRRKALELFKNHKIGTSELQIFFPNSLELLEKAIDNLSISLDKRIDEPRYTLRKVVKKDYCEMESDESEYDSIAEESLLNTTSEIRASSPSSKGVSINQGLPEAGENIAPLRWNLPKSFAAKTLPDGLVLKCSDRPNAVLGIFTTREINKNTIFGPYVGVRVYNDEVTKISGRVWEIFVNGYLHHYILGEDTEQSNWMRYVNHSASPAIQNLESFQYRYKVYYKTLADIPEGTELMVWYSKDYNQDSDDIDSKGKWVKSKRKLSQTENFSDSSTSTKAKSENVATLKNPAQDSSVKNTKLKCGTSYDVEMRFKCDVCGSTFSRNDHLKRHARIHTGEKPYKCDVCGSTFSQNGDLKRHARIHTGEKPYKCDVCGSTFSRNGHLKDHTRIHTGERPYKCDVCGSTFSQNGDLKTHARIHTGEKPYKCDVCGSTFSQNGHLKGHTRIHTGEKPYKCDVCGSTFSQNGHLKTHMRIHTGENSE